LSIRSWTPSVATHARATSGIRLSTLVGYKTSIMPVTLITRPMMIFLSAAMLISDRRHSAEEANERVTDKHFRSGSRNDLAEAKGLA
jgi:hypothetical protein